MPRGSTKYPLPIHPGGVREDVNIASVPEGAWLTSSNFLVRQGQGRARPGYTLIDTLSPANRVLGFGFRGSPSTSTNLVAHTTTNAYNYDGTTFMDITGTWTTSQPEELVRFAAFPTGGVLYLARVNHANAMDIWPGTGSFVSPTDAAPRARDLCVTNSRLMLVNTIDSTNNPYQVRWCDFLDINTWPTGTTNTAELSETPDEIIGCAALGPLSAAIYKEDSVWVSQAVAAKNPFQFQLIGFVPGPVSPAAIVPYRGAHYWLGKDGVIYRFDGTRFDAISSGLITTFRETFDHSARLRTHGFVLALQEPEIWWVYPEAESGLVIRAMCLNLVTNALSPHTFADELTASGQWLAQADVTWDSLTGTWDTLGLTYPTWDSMGSQSRPTAVVGGAAGEISQLGIAATDDGTDIAWSYTNGWKIPAMGQRLVVDGIMTYWHQESSSVPVTVSATASDDLSDEDNAVSRIYDLATKDNHYVTFGDLRGSFVRLTQGASRATTSLSCRGGVLLGWPRGLV